MAESRRIVSLAATLYVVVRRAFPLVTADVTAKPAALLSLLFLMAASPLSLAATHLGCGDSNCYLTRDGFFGHIVVGELKHVQSDEEMRQLFRWASKVNTWRDFKGTEDEFVDQYRLVTIGLSSKQSVMVHMARKEFDGKEWNVGDLVRYRPTDPERYRRQGRQPENYGPLAGCVIVLCRTTDNTCHSRYHNGAYNKDSGREVRPVDGKLLVKGGVIDVDTLLPKHE